MSRSAMNVHQVQVALFFRLGFAKVYASSMARLTTVTHGYSHAILRWQPVGSASHDDVESVGSIRRRRALAGRRLDGIRKTVADILENLPEDEMADFSVPNGGSHSPAQA